MGECANICGGCKQLIAGKPLFAFDMAWHVDHLLCKVCKCKFKDGLVCEGPDGYAYCRQHWKSTFCPICANCDDYIEGQVVNALDKHYHPEHFICSVCKEALSYQFFPSATKDPLCEWDYYSSLKLICHECEKPITAGKFVKVESDGVELKYHYNHFYCNFCKSSIVGQKYRIHKGKPFCISCSLKYYG